ncbi:MAG TPA: tetratricopeptide repeat protein, partial [Bryobacteraceae bacterium]
VPRRGYRWVSPVVPTTEPVSLPASSPPPIEPVQETRLSRRTVITALVFLLGITAFTGYWRLHALRDGTVPKIRLAVLPLENMTGDPAQDYICDGLTEEMITSLGRLQPNRLAVIARTSVMQYKKTARTVRDIGKELGVDYVLEGSIRGQGASVRVTVQLIQVRDESHLWADTYDRDLRNLIGVQAEVARNVAGQVRLTLDSRHAAQIESPLDARAHDEYLLGRYQWNKRTEEGYEKAITHFERAIAIDPAYAAAYAGLADSYILLGGAVHSQSQTIPKAAAAARKALEIDPLQPEAHASLGLIAMNYDWDWVASEREYRRALEINPNYATAHHWYAEYLNMHGRFDEAVLEIGRAQELDPLSLIIATDRGKIWFYARRYPEALQQLRRVLAEDPSYREAHIYLIETFLAVGKFEEALADMNQFPAWARETWALDCRAFALGRLGRRSEARNLIAELEQAALKDGRWTYGGLAYIGVGDSDKALSSYEYAVGSREISSTSLRVHPLLDPLRGSTRFQALIKKVGL